MNTRSSIGGGWDNVDERELRGILSIRGAVRSGILADVIPYPLCRHGCLAPFDIAATTQPNVQGVDQQLSILGVYNNCKTVLNICSINNRSIDQ
jgi:hypothetical protein